MDLYLALTLAFALCLTLQTFSLQSLPFLTFSFLTFSFLTLAFQTLAFQTLALETFPLESLALPARAGLRVALALLFVPAARLRFALPLLLVAAQRRFASSLVLLPTARFGLPLSLLILAAAGLVLAAALLLVSATRLVLTTALLLLPALLLFSRASQVLESAALALGAQLLAATSFLVAADLLLAPSLLGSAEGLALATLQLPQPLVLSPAALLPVAAIPIGVPAGDPAGDLLDLNHDPGPVERPGAVPGVASAPVEVALVVEVIRVVADAVAPDLDVEYHDHTIHDLEVVVGRTSGRPDSQPAHQQTADPDLPHALLRNRASTRARGQLGLELACAGARLMPSRDSLDPSAGAS